jgi:integrase
MGTLSVILNAAVDDGLIPSSPAARWGRVIRQDQREVEQIEVFTTSELQRLLATVERNDPDYYPFLLCLARTGLRLGEAMALQWADVDFASRVILVRRSLRRGETKITKNGKARRVDMSRQLAEVLQGWKSLKEADATVEGRTMPAWVFRELFSARDPQGAFRLNVWERLLRAAELRYRKPHTLRHSYASLLIEAGESITYVQNQLGHATAAFTLSVYAHFVPRGDRRAVDSLDDATGRNLYATAPERTPATTRS